MKKKKKKKQLGHDGFVPYDLAMPPEAEGFSRWASSLIEKFWGMLVNNLNWVSI